MIAKEILYEIKETHCTKKAHIVIGEGLIEQYYVIPGEEEAKAYAVDRVRQSPPGTHWIVFKPVCGYIQTPKAQ